MKSEDITIQQAVNDLAAIKRAINSSQNSGEGIPKSPSALDAGLVTHIIGAVIGSLILVYELSSSTITTVMMLSKTDHEIGVWGLSQVATIIPVLVMCLYFIIWREAKHAGESFQTYAGRNFRYLKNLAFGSDLLCKFIPLSFLVVAGQAQWVAPLLLLFQADFLIGGKYFTLTVHSALVGGVLCLLLAGLQYSTLSSSVAWPLAVFVIFSIASIGMIVRARSKT